MTFVCWDNSNVAENKHVEPPYGLHRHYRILFETNFKITQLAMFDLILRFNHHRLPSSGTAADGGRNVEVSRTLLVV